MNTRTTLSMLAALAVMATPVTHAASPCPAVVAHQFDFWIGEWSVTYRDKPAGHNSIQPILDGCVLQERWSGVSGSAGTSLNFYDPQRGHWRQLWVWREGTTLELEGDYRDGKMVLEGDSVVPDRPTQRNRISWSRNEDGSVRQLWEISEDGGTSWRTEFDGLYRRAAAARAVRKPASR